VINCCDKTPAADTFICCGSHDFRVARFTLKNAIFGTFWKALVDDGILQLWPFGSFYGHLVYFTAI
jgi:hypothetical protein